MALVLSRGDMKLMIRMGDLALKELYRQIDRKLLKDHEADTARLESLVEEIAEFQERVEQELG